MRWTEEKIGSFCDTGSGGTPSRDRAAEFYGGSIPWVKSGELRESIVSQTAESLTAAGLANSSAKIVPPGALLVAMYGATVGRVGILGIQAATNQAVCHIIPRAERADTRYLFHCLQAKLPVFLSRSVGGAQPNISQEIIKDTLVPLPPLEEQRRIAAILDKADVLRQKRRAALQKLDSLTQSLFLDMFGDPLVNDKKWPVRPFGNELVDIKYGTGTPPEYSAEPDIPFIRATNIKNGTVQSDGLKFISPAEAAKIEKCKLSYGDLIIVRSGVNAGDCGLIPKKFSGAYAGYDLIVRLDLNKAYFYNFLLNSSFGQRLLEPLTRRAAQPHLNADQVKGLNMIAPPAVLIVDFAEKLMAVDRIRKQEASNLNNQIILFSSLQHRAFRGEL